MAVLVAPFERESPIPIPQTQSAFHRRAQRNAFRRPVNQPTSVLAVAGLKLLPEHGAHSPFCNCFLKLFIVAFGLVSVKFSKLCQGIV